MRAIKNMDIAEIKATQDRYTAKHPITDKYDLQGLQLCQYAETIKAAVQGRDNEVLQQTIADIFNYGFMNGAKQTAKKVETDAESHYFNDSQRKLTELAYHLPLGAKAEYFYTFMVLMLNNDCNGIEQMLPARQKKAFIECVNQAEQRKQAKESEER